MNKLLIHIVHDDKFIDMGLREFESAAQGINRAVYVGKNQQLHYVKSKNILFLDVSEAKQFIQSDECAAVIFHSLNEKFLPLLNGIPSDKIVVWLGWGYDYYGRLLSAAYTDGLFLTKTKQVLAQSYKSGGIYKFARNVKNALKHLVWRNQQYDHSLLKRVDYFIPVIDVEHAMARELNPWFKAKYVCWNYGTLEDDFSGGEINCSGVGDDILVGNSATPENNHLEVFELLASRVELGNKKIIVPLSYGDSWYRKRIIDAGNSLFANNFLPLTGFVDKEEYIRILSGCGYVFMNHLRQQALGNLCIMMHKGARIYMNPKSPVYHWLIEKGGVIDSIESLPELNEKQRHSLRPLNDIDRSANVDVIRGYWGRNAQKNKTRYLIDLVMRGV